MSQKTPSQKKSALVVCPGRGTYNAAELGYFKTHHSDKSDFIEMIDDLRRDSGQVPISELDGADRFSPSLHGRGDNASLLIYACAISDFMSINKDLYDVIGVTGNSMGWYLALAAGGALTHEDGAKLVNKMGGIMTEHGRGGQVVFSGVNDEWQSDSLKRAAIERVLEHPDIYTSIHLGGMTILAAGEAGLKHALSTLPKDARFPFQIRGHAAFHSPLLSQCRSLAQDALNADMFTTPTVPLIDGVGNVWSPHSTDIDALYDYTLGRQIDETFNFSKAVEVGVKEFAPDVIIVLGPGTTLGAPVAQTLIAQNWQGLSSKSEFKARQESAPYVLSMGIEDQRKHVIGG